jgi:hypothetical protein
MTCRVLAFLALAGCPSTLETTAPQLVEPLDGTTIDRCVVRVRIDPPGRDLKYVESAQFYAAYKLDGGAPIHARAWTQDRDPTASFVFPVTLHTGANRLEVGRCDGDECGWSTANVTVAQHPGSPDCAAPGSGSLITTLPWSSKTRAIALGGGRFATSHDAGTGPLAHTTLTWSAADGSIDTSMTTTTMPFDVGVPVLASRPTGGWFGAFQRPGNSHLVRIGTNGVLDTTFGTNGSLDVRAPDNRGLGIMTLTPASGGGYYAGGTVEVPAMPLSRIPFGMHVDEQGVVTSFTELDPGSGVWETMDIAIDESGRFRATVTDAGTRMNNFVLAGTIGSGITTNYGTQGHAALPSDPGVSSITLDGVVVTVAQLHEGDLRILRLDGNGAPVSTIELPLQSPYPTGLDVRPRMWSAPDGSLYVTVTVGHDPEVARSWGTDPQVGTDVATVRIRNGALDTSFGDAGISKVSSMLAYDPISTETVYDTALALGPSASGGPAMLTYSQSTPTTAQGEYTVRGPALGRIELLP